MHGQHLNILPGPPDPASTSCTLPFKVWVLSEAPPDFCRFGLIFCVWDCIWGFFSFEGLILENLPVLLGAMGFFQAGTWIGQGLLSGSPGLFSSFLSYSYLSRTWTSWPSQPWSIIPCLYVRGLAVCLSSSAPWSPVSASKYTPVISQNARALLCCPSSRYWGNSSPPWGLGLWTWGFFNFSEEDLIYFFLFIWQFVADTHHIAFYFGLPSNPNP